MSAQAAFYDTTVNSGGVEFIFAGGVANDTTLAILATKES
jgi:autotransporter passenger strand-loop-strand repeat protein